MTPLRTAARLRGWMALALAGAGLTFAWPASATPTSLSFAFSGVVLPEDPSIAAQVSATFGFDPDCTSGFEAMITGEHRIGFANPGVPHLVILVDDTSAVDVVARGRPLRLDRRLKHGANVNFVAPRGAGTDEFSIRTYERGVEAETLACGTGAVASAALLHTWGYAGKVVRLITKSGKTLVVTLRRKPDGHLWPSLSGEARIVYQGRTAEL